MGLLTGVYVTVLPKRVQELLVIDPKIQFHKVPPSLWLELPEDTVMDDLCPQDEQYQTVRHVVEEMGVPLLRRDTWDAVGDVTTSVCRYVNYCN